MTTFVTTKTQCASRAGSENLPKAIMGILRCVHVCVYRVHVCEVVFGLGFVCGVVFERGVAGG